MASRPQKTLTDYLVIAISPALIMLIVGSLVFFLQELGYRGEYPDRMRWILFWVVFAFVLTARIGIEQGREHARIYGLALAVVTVLAMIRYADSVVLSSVLLLIAWWCADKLTWDCTLVDDNEDASGTGLLDTAPARASENASDQSSTEPDTTKAGRAPGRTVLYFSLAALPLFGIGQVFIPANNVESRTDAFRLLWVYLASALALLLSTSFLGLRRYLRQRRLEMPANIVRTWIGTGTVLILLILACCIFLPRPDAAYSVASLGEVVESTVRNASKIAFLGGDAGKNKGRRIGEEKDNAEAGDEDRANKQRHAQDKAAAENNGKARNNDEKKNSDATDGEKGSGKSGEGSSKKSDEQDARKSKGDGNESETKSDGESAESDKSQAGNRSSQKRGDDQDKAAESDREKGDEGDDRKKAESDREEKDAAAKDRKDLKGRRRQQQEQNQQAQQPGRKQNGAKAADAKQKIPGNDAATPAEKKPSPSNTDLSDWLGSMAKWILYGLFAVFMVWILIRYWSQIVDALAQLWTALLALFGGRKKEPAAPRVVELPEEPVRRPLPFAAFQNPFVMGTADRTRVEALVQYTFDALQAWANDRNLGRVPEQTPLEFAKSLGTRVPNLSREIDDTAHLYARVAYSSHPIPRSCLPILEKLWRRMSSE